MLGGPRQRERAAADDDEHDRRAGRDHRLEQLLLPAEEPEPHAGRGTRPSSSRRSGPIARRARRWRRRRRGRASTAAASSSSVPDEMPVPRAWTTSRAGSAPRMRVQDRPPAGQLVARLEDLAVADDAERIDAGAHLLERLHVDEVAVVAEQVAGAVRDRPDDREPPEPGRERQHAVVLEQDERALGERPRGRATPSVGERPRAPRRSGPRRTAARTGRAGTSSAARVRPPRRAAPRPRARRRGRPPAGVPKATVRGSSASTPAASASAGRLAEVSPSAGGRSRASRRPCSPRRRSRRSPTRRAGSSSAARARRGTARRRRRSRPASRWPIPAWRTAASNGKSCSSRSSRGADVRRRLVEAALGQPVADHVLGRREHAVGEVGALERLDVGAAELGREVGVLAVGLLDPAPARVARDVEDGRQRVPGTGQAASAGGSSRPSPSRGPGRTWRPRRSTAGSTARPRR